MSKKFGNFFITLLGVLLLGTGLFLVKSYTDPQGIMKALPFVLIGIGCGLFGQGVGNIISQKVMRNNPDIQKQKEIEVKDERNTAIRNRAKAKAYDMMVFVFGALMLAFALMGVDMIAVLLLVFAYLYVIGYGIYYRSKYEKEM